MGSTSTRTTRSAAHDDGFTIPEFIAAAAILFIVLVGIMGAVEYAGATTRMSAMRQGAIDVAQAQIELDRNLPWNNLGLTYANGNVGNPAGTIPATQTLTTTSGTYSVTTNVSWAIDLVNKRASYKKLTVTVGWSTPTPGTFSIDTAVFGQGQGVANTGDIMFTAADVENPSKTIPGITITMGPYSGSTNTAVTGSDGTALFSTIPIGKIKSLSGTDLSLSWLVDVSGVGLPTIASGWNTPVFVYCQKPATATFHVKSASIPNIAGAKVTLTDTGTHAATYIGYTDANGYVTFSASNNDVGGLAGLWKDNYTAVASTGTVSSTSFPFQISAGGQAYGPQELTIPDPPSITVSMKVATTGQALTGKTWTVTLKNPSGTSLGTVTTSNNSVTFVISVAGSYTAIVTGVSGFLDNPGFTVAGFTATGSNQSLVVPMNPLFQVGVRASGSLISVPATITMKNASSGSTVTSIAPAGLANFIIPADGNYNMSAVVNGISYPLSGILQTSLVAASPPLTPYYIDFTAGHLSVASVPPGSGYSGIWSRIAAVYDSSKALVASSAATTLTPTPVFTLPGGNYTVVMCSASTTVAPNPQPSGASYRFYPVVVPTDGTWYYLTGALAAN